MLETSLMGGLKRALALNTIDNSTERGRSADRFRRAALTTIAAAIAKGVALLTTLVSVPLTLNYLGAERYGMWVAISSLTALFEFADLGLGNGLQNLVTAKRSVGPGTVLREYVSSTFFLLIGVGILGSAIFALLSPLIPWDTVFKTQTLGAVGEASTAAAVFIYSITLALPLGVVRRVQTGFQEGFTTNVWLCFGSLISLVSLLIAIRSHGNLPTLVFCVTGATIVPMAVNSIAEFIFHRPSLCPNWRYVTHAAATRLIKTGFHFMCLQGSFLIFVAVDALIAARVLGLADATRISTAQRLFLFAPTIQALWLLPLWPAYGDAAARGDTSWIRRTLIRSTIVSTLFSCVIGACLIVFRQQIFSAWVGSKLVPSLDVACALAFSAVLLSAGTAVSIYLNGVNLVQQQVMYTLVTAVVSVAARIYLSERLGILGLPIGLIIVYVTICIPATAALVYKSLHNPSIGGSTRWS